MTSNSKQNRKKVQNTERRKTQVFSCEYCEIFKNTYFEERLQTGASDKRKERNG